MNRIDIAPEDFNSTVFKAWNEDWFLLTCGELENNNFNPMTVAWGSFGVMWRKPFVQVVVRPSRHTHTFSEQYDSFTLCAFPENCKDALKLCGSKSGRDMDKVKEAGLTPLKSAAIDAPGFDEAELIIECRTMYRTRFDPADFKADFIEPCYGGSDYHTVYYGEVLAIHGTAEYKS